MTGATCGGDGGGPRRRKARQGGPPPLSPRTSEPGHGDYDPVRNPWREKNLVWVEASRHDHLHSQLVRLQLPRPPADICQRLIAKSFRKTLPVN